MSNVTSNSELTTKEIVEQAISDYHMSILPYLAKGNNGYSETPIGAMQMFDDDTAPSGWLVADGTVYDIDDYPFLANHIERVHGSKNYYGGNGTTTFAVPDWQGEFFRAAGPNAHPNQGDGAAVGEHQDATELINIEVSANDGIYLHTKDSESFINKNIDSSITNATHYDKFNESSRGSDPNYTTYIMPRPTNTSLLCCIKAVPAGINYSLEEQEIGTWIDGKPLYQKTWSVDIALGGNGSESTYSISDIANMGTINIVNACATPDGDVSYNTLYLGRLFGAMIKRNNNVIAFGQSSSGTANLYHVKWFTIQYTKTTDV